MLVKRYAPMEIMKMSLCGKEEFVASSDYDTLLARDNIKTFAEQEVRIAELTAELARVKAESLRVVQMTEDRSPLNMDTVVRHATINGHVVRLEKWETEE